MDIERKGKQRKVVIQRDQARVFIGFCIPAIVKDSVLKVEFDGYSGVPRFTAKVEPWEAKQRLDNGDRELGRR